jgi:hypothetical protein
VAFPLKHAGVKLKPANRIVSWNAHTVHTSQSFGTPVVKAPVSGTAARLEIFFETTAKLEISSGTAAIIAIFSGIVAKLEISK